MSIPPLNNFQCPEPTASTSVAHAVSSAAPTAETKPKKVTKISAYHKDFEQHLIDYGIYPAIHVSRKNPRNLSEIERTVARRRPSVTSQFSREGFEALKIECKESLTEAAVTLELFSIVAGRSNNHWATNLLFGNLRPLTNGVLSDPRPDYWDGADTRQIGNRLQEELKSYITPSTNPRAPILPNFFVEIKGPSGDTPVNERQAWYDGVLGARGIQKLRSFEAGDVETFDDKAYTITSTIHNGILQLFAVHATLSIHPEKPEYHMTSIGGWHLLASINGFLDGVSAFRNARAWARAQRDELITAANRRMLGNHAQVPGGISTPESNNHLSQTPGGPLDYSPESSLHNSLSPRSSQSPSQNSRSPRSSQNGSQSPLCNRVHSRPTHQSPRFSPYRRVFPRYTPFPRTRIPTPKNKYPSPNDSPSSSAAAESVTQSSATGEEVVPRLLPSAVVIPEPEKPTASPQSSRSGRLSSTQSQASRNSRFSPYKRPGPNSRR
ncbi:hypothetical protein MMC07_006659 [Pseudocyphellaria aurata]|nr:hypothetical protein [Pseudocyphellaria aurata]